MVDLLELVAERLADADRLAADTRLEAANRVDLGHLGPGQTGAGGNAVGHRIRHQFRPALAPQIVGRLGAVGMRDQAQDLLRPLGDATVDLTGAIDSVAAALAADAATMDVAWCDEADADVAGYAAEHLSPPRRTGGRAPHAAPAPERQDDRACAGSESRARRRPPHRRSRWSAAPSPSGSRARSAWRGRARRAHPASRCR